ncbi:MAG: hypothetical protein RQ714_06265 [Nitrosomonas sp.]|nr:hypothetical protein [Nitrosomonas sp.]
MYVDMVVPALFWPDRGQPESYHQLQLSALEKILAKGRYSKCAPASMEAWLCQFFAIEKQQDWPVAPIMAQLDDRNISGNRDGYWLRADPVHLRIENNHILLVDSQMLNISPKEASDFADSINELLIKEGLVLLPLQSHRWYVYSHETPAMQTRLLGEVAGKNINHQLPIGDDSIDWIRRINEIQMLLHEHPLNQRRETHGEPVINSLWIWGGGIMPKNLTALPVEIWGNYAFAQGLADAHGMECRSLPDTAHAWLSSVQGDGRRQLILLDGLQKPACYRNIVTWRNELARFECDWFSPLLDLLKKNRISRLTLTVLGEDATRVFRLTPRSLWKLWAVSRPMEKYD